MNGEIVIKKLETADIDQVSRFRMSASEDEALQIFIRKHAKKSADASLTKTYVAKMADDKKVIGYISMMCAEVALEKTYSIDDKAGADRWDHHPAIRISRLAVCDEHRGKSIGPRLVKFAIGITLDIIEPHTGCRFIILDAKRKSIKFYEEIGFNLLNTPTNKNEHAPLMFLDLKKV